MRYKKDKYNILENGVTIHLSARNAVLLYVYSSDAADAELGESQSESCPFYDILYLSLYRIYIYFLTSLPFK